MKIYKLFEREFEPVDSGLALSNNYLTPEILQIQLPVLNILIQLLSMEAVGNIHFPVTETSAHDVNATKSFQSYRN
ncbi:unnamed protein product [Sphenostylis stenocarpa]|uniref:Uncharacterized protein n=1 Tax=Sphenostylis stenocarpa TaxID=92480 RepID=A0AA86SUY9_9FABA|nr:unnamed protein product [Sphenostylis stenocarpa]